MLNRNLNDNFFKRIFTLFLFAIILTDAFPVAAQQTKRNAAKTPQTVDKKIIYAEQNNTPTEIISPKPEISVMSQSWESGELPPPLALPEGNSDEAVRNLARKVAARNAESIPALLTALQMAGFFITDKSGQILHTPADGKGQGLPINGWEAASVARMYGENRTINLSALDKQLKSVPVLRGIARDGEESIAAVLLEGIKENADNTDNPYLRVWARFIIELGKNSAGKYDLTDGALKAEQINLDAIQHLLIMRRLYGDFWATADKYKNEAARAESGVPARNQTKVSFINAGFSPDSARNYAANCSGVSRFAGASDEPKRQETICRLDGDNATISDGVATIIGMVWDSKLERAAEGGDPDIVKAKSRHAAFLTTANILLVYAKFIQTYAALDVTISAEDGGSPLIRTKNKVPGARKNLRAEVRLKIGKWQDFNCLRLALNTATGLDFSTLNDGPLGGVGVQWGLTTGGDGDFYSNSTGINHAGEQIVGFAAQTTKRIQDKGVGTGRGSLNFTFNKTDDKGISEATLVGSPQKNEKVSMRVMPVKKRARVVTSIEIKAGDIKGDAVDVYGQWADGLPGLLYMPAELLYRTSWAASGALIVPVTDWEECAGGWSGKIEIKRKSKQWSRGGGKGVKIGYAETTTSRTYEYEGKVNIENAQPLGISGVSGANKAFAAQTITLKGESDATSKIVWEDSSLSTYRDNCGKQMTTRTLFNNTRREERGSGQDTAEGRLIINRRENTYSFQVVIPQLPGKTTETVLRRPTGYCRTQDNEPTTKTSEWSNEIDMMPIQVTDGILDPDFPNLIEGTRAYTTPEGEEIEITWSLRNCA